MDIIEFIEESNRIEGIHRDPTQAEIEEFQRFMQLKKVTIDDLRQFVNIYQPNAELRDVYGMDVRVGQHFPPRGGPHISEMLQVLLDSTEVGLLTAHRVHIQYESLHPFNDCNGRSGRMLWAWQVGVITELHLGFLHRFYYQTLDAIR